MTTNATSASTADVVIGAGPVGTTIALQLAEAGRPVRLLTRSGSGPEHPLIERRRADAHHRHDLSGAFADAEVIYDCMHASAYRADVWRAELPGAEQVVLAAAGAAGATVVFPESLYSFGRVDGPITETTPRSGRTGKPGIRTELLAARAASSTRTISIAAGDFYGPYVGAAGHAGERMVRAVLSGTTLYAVGDPSVAHSWTYVPDLAAAMIAAARLDPDRLDGVDGLDGLDGLDGGSRHALLLAPTAAPTSQREMAAAYAAAAGLETPRVVGMPSWLLHTLGVVHRGTREIAEMSYQFTRPFTMDSTVSERVLGLAATPLAEGARATMSWWREHDAVASTPSPVR